MDGADPRAGRGGGGLTLTARLPSWRTVAERLRTVPGFARVVLRGSSRSFFDARGSDLAASLAYSSLLSFVPLAVSATVLTSTLFGTQGTGFWRLLRFVLPGASIEFVQGVRALVDRAQTLSTFATIVLLLGSIRVFFAVEGAMNALWGVTRPRPILRRAGLAFGVVLAGPVALGVATSLVLESGAPFTQFRLSGLALSSVLVALFYRLVPSAHVRWGPAAAAGTVAGTGVSLLKWAFVKGVAAFADFHTLYGSISAAVIFVIAAGLVWGILLYGVSLAHALQFRDELLAHDEPPRASKKPGALEETTQLLLLLTGARASGSPPPELADLASRCSRQEGDVAARLKRLESAGLVRSEGNGWQLARSPETISLYAVARAIGETSPRAVPAGDDPVSAALRSLYLRADREERGVLQGTSLWDLYRPLFRSRDDEPITIVP